MKSGESWIKGIFCHQTPKLVILQLSAKEVFHFSENQNIRQQSKLELTVDSVQDNGCSPFSMVIDFNYPQQ